MNAGELNPLIMTFNYNLLYTEFDIVLLCPHVLIQKALNVYHSEITPSNELDNEDIEENKVLIEVMNESRETNKGDGEDERQKQKPTVCISIYLSIHIYIILVYFYSSQSLLG